MTAARFLKIALPVLAIPALVVLFLPARVWPTYVDIVEPLALFIGFLLALNVASIYRKELQNAFIFFAVFLLIYMFAIILFLSYSPTLRLYFELRLGTTETLRLVEGIQFINYAMLFLFCLNLLKGIDVTRLNKKGWLVLILAALFSLFVAIYPQLGTIVNNANLTMATVLAFSMRVLDAVLIIVLIPVLWLYVQYLKSRQQQSLTFTIIVFGIVFSTLFDYLFELVITLFPALLPPESLFRSAIPETLFIYGYLIIAAGLYAHRKQDDWGYQAIDRAMAGELSLTDVDDG
ncbi:MAG: hypothetical protein ABIH70_07685 [Chloroflexota bacterium]